MHPDDPLERHFRLQPLQKMALKKLGLSTLRDLLFYLPARYGEAAKAKHINELTEGEHATICGRVFKNTVTKAYVKKIPIAEVLLEDTTGRIRATWFHQAYMAKKVPEGGFARVTGTVTKRADALYFANPTIEAVESLDLLQESSLFATDHLTVAPIYPETRGLSSLWLRHHIERLLRAKVHEHLIDPIPQLILDRYHLPGLRTALVWIHSPRKEADAHAARKRFAFEEIFLIQLARKQAKRAYQSNPANIMVADAGTVAAFTKRFPFAPTSAQEQAIERIMDDVRSGHPMTRLLEGDVGSGKTAVAATAAYATIVTAPEHNKHARLQVAYMAPTEILARQHFASFITYFAHTGIQIGLLTGSECRKYPSKITAEQSTPISRTQLLKWVAAGDISIVIGTHALIYKSVQFRDLGLVIVDEQHRFGVKQRLQLAQKHTHLTARNGEKAKERRGLPSAYGQESKALCPVPHLLSMTATPIPRTLALTIYGDLDLTLLDQMPIGRKPIVTKIIIPGQRQDTYETIRAELHAGRQLYVICPRIDEPDPNVELAVNAKSAKAEAERLKKSVFPEYTVGVVHSKLMPKEKESVMQRFSKGEIQILVATSVIEVGVNVPNATMIIIEGAERFGLAQLHQLRGRVIRSNHQAYCYVLTESKSAATVARLKALIEAKNGFELAERDLELRGAGELGGKRQWGVSDIGMEAIKNLKMVEAAREEAEALLAADPTLVRTPLLAKAAAEKATDTHFE